MTTFLSILSWVFCALFVIIALLVLGMGGRLQFFLLLGIALILFPPFRSLLQNTLNFSIQWWGYLIAGIVLWMGMIASFVLNPATSIYKSEEYRTRLLQIYDDKLAQWPVPYESVFIETEYGRIHVIVSGPEDAPAILLINASGLSGWSWIHNVATLCQEYRTFAVDNIGEGGKNEMLKPGHIPKNGQQIADFYSDISEKLGIKTSSVIGASIGGYIGTNYALYAPERVEKLILLGSMGYGSTMKTVIAMTIAQGFPAKPVQETTFGWAFGDAPGVRDSFGEWFRVYMKGLIPTPVAPATFTPEQLRELKVPTLAYFGTKDGVIGDAEKARILAENIPDARIELVESGHVISAELPDLVNPAILEFLRE